MEFGPGVAATFLYYFTSTAVILSFVVAQSIGLGIDTGVPQQVGALGGLMAGILGTYFNRTISFSVPYESAKKFLNQLETTLSQLGYEQIAETDGVHTYQRSGLSKWFSGRIFVQTEAGTDITQDRTAATGAGTATIASRAITIRNLKKVIQ